MENTSIRFRNGSEWKSNEGLKFSIIGRINRKIGKEYPYYLCKFEDGFIMEIKYTHIIDGQVKNPNFPSVCGVGFMGIGIWKSCVNSKRTKEYNTWIRMINACYNVDYKDYPNYGEKGIIVDDRWHNFQLFCEDIPNIQGYNEWRCGKYQLDKDIMCDMLNISPKVYSKDTCIFVSQGVNGGYSSLTGQVYVAKRISDEYEEEFTNASEFSKKYNLNDRSVRYRLKKTSKSRIYEGWIFRLKI